jgi:hypothetical protein
LDNNLYVPYNYRLIIFYFLLVCAPTLKWWSCVWSLFWAVGQRKFSHTHHVFCIYELTTKNLRPNYIILLALQTSYSKGSFSSTNVPKKNLVSISSWVKQDEFEHYLKKILTAGEIPVSGFQGPLLLTHTFPALSFSKADNLPWKRSRTEPGAMIWHNWNLWSQTGKLLVRITPGHLLTDLSKKHGAFPTPFVGQPGRSGKTICWLSKKLQGRMGVSNCLLLLLLAWQARKGD